jgi:flavin reductase (DIM6/NTAB) family NADH-FMN oxidoreductase RutF
MDYATHTIFVARVYSAKVQNDVDPLLYQDGKYAIAQPVIKDLEERRINAVSVAAT